MWTPRLLIAAVVVIAISAVGWRLYEVGKRSGMSQVQAQWNLEKLAMTEAMNAELQRARQREDALKTLTTRLSEDHRREKNRIRTEHAAIVDSLRNRPETRAGDGGVPQGADAGVGCTGAGLARPDAAFLVGYAADAARLQSALNACRAAYAEVEREINRTDFAQKNSEN
jgi:hypothetical protein